MAAADHLHPVQMKLFMGAREWKQSVTDSVDMPFTRNRTTMASLWRSKLAEAKQPKGKTTHGAGTYASIEQVGYVHGPDARDRPTIILDSYKATQGEGHHRIAAAADIEQKTKKNIWIPTNYVDRGY